MKDSGYKISLPEGVRVIIERLENAGFEAWAVGGCIRDSLLGREPKDWDITTSALPEEMKAIFPRTVDTGIEHGTVTVLLGQEAFETTTYRIDGKYSDSRHPDNVEFSRSLDEDLKRRDFTINAMAYSDSGGLVDMFGGKQDMDLGIIRCVGDPDERFSEDALRILRAVRFSAQLDFTIDPDTLAAASRLKDRLKLISAERIHAELDKILLSDHPDRLKLLYETGIASIILPKLDQLFINDPDRASSMLDLLAASPGNRIIRWAIFVSRTGSGVSLLRSLKFDNHTIGHVSGLLRLENAPLSGLSDAMMRKLINDADEENMPELLAYRSAIDPHADYSPAYEQFRTILDRGDCTSLRTLAVNGKDLIDHGVSPGKEVGDALKSLLDIVLEDPGLNRRNILLDRLNTIKYNHKDQI